MTITPKVLYTGGQLTTSAVALYTCPANTKAAVSAATFTNTDTVARLLSVYLVRSSGTALATNILIDAQSLAPGQAYTCPELIGQQLAATDAVQALADANAKITCAGISGFEFA